MNSRRCWTEKTSSPKGELTGKRGVLFQALGCQKIIGICEQGFFRRAARDSKHGDLSFPLLRFDNEVHRLYGVLNLGLFNKPYLAAGVYTIADMICYPWASLWQGRSIDLEEFFNVKRWLATVGERPAVKKGIAIGKELRDLTCNRDACRRRGKPSSTSSATLSPSAERI
jgi:Glutathione S-transferase, C-terminal domain